MTKILIAEDERDIRDLVAFTLTYGGYEVVTAINGAEAVEHTLKEKPDLVILDVRMPKMTGYEACIALKENAQTKDIPIVFLSAKGQETEVGKGLEVGAVDYILKPFAPDELLKRLKEILDKIDSEQPKPAQKPTPAKADTGKKAGDKSSS